MKKIIAILFFILTASVVIFLIIYPTLKKSDTITIHTFEQCVRAGYPVLESYPRQCSLPDGKFFTETILVSSCKADGDCPQFEYCQSGSCTPMDLQTQCSYDSDCTLVNVEDRFSCCYTGACRQVDYAQSSWKAVNKNWFMGKQTELCPKECGPQPLCASRAINLSYAARCSAKVCVKVEKSTVK